MEGEFEEELESLEGDLEGELKILAGEFERRVREFGRIVWKES